MKNNVQRMDLGEGSFFARELEVIKGQLFERQYPDMKHAVLIPISPDADPTAEFITYRMFDKQGIAKIVANYGDDLPRADIEAREFTIRVFTLAMAVGWNIFELRAAEKAGRPIDRAKLMAASENVQRLADRLAFLGDSTVGIVGFTNNANVPDTVVATSGAAVTWAAKIALGTLAGIEAILADLNAPFVRMATATKGKESINTVVLSPSSFAQIASTRIPDTDSTILEFFLKAHPGVMVETCHWLETSGTGATKQMVAYNRSPEKLQLEIPQDVEVHEAQDRGLEVIAPVTMRFGGCNIMYPLSMDYSYGM